MFASSTALLTILWVVNSEANFGNASSHELPVLRSGQICTPGKAYRVDCNTCRCGHNNILLCTKMTCLDRGALAVLMKKRLLEKINAKKYQGVRHHAKREGKPNVAKERTLLYPELPVGNCKPGKIYQVGCNRCFCTDDKEAICAKIDCDNEVNFRPARTPKDVRPPFTKPEADSLPSLSHAAAKCQPGKAYRVDCNSCLCLADGNTLCGDLLCVSHEDMNRLLAKKLSGGPCNETTKLLIGKGCVECACVAGMQQCRDIRDCTPEVLRSLHGAVPKALNRQPGSCVPKSVYKEDCNRCYCQADKSMRCTRKKCLNYSQVKKLQQLRLALEKTGH